MKTKQNTSPDYFIRFNGHKICLVKCSLGSACWLSFVFLSCKGIERFAEPTPHAARISPAPGRVVEVRRRKAKAAFSDKVHLFIYLHVTFSDRLENVARAYFTF